MSGQLRIGATALHDVQHDAQRNHGNANGLPDVRHVAEQDDVVNRTENDLCAPHQRDQGGVAFP